MCRWGPALKLLGETMTSGMHVTWKLNHGSKHDFGISVLGDGFVARKLPGNISKTASGMQYGSKIWNGSEWK